MQRIVLESPYAGDVARNRAYLNACIADACRRGESPYASHKMLTDSLDDTGEHERRQGIEAGLVWGEMADYIVLYVDLGISPGMRLAENYYLSKGKEVKHRALPAAALVALGITDTDRYAALRVALREPS